MIERPASHPSASKSDQRLPVLLTGAAGFIGARLAEAFNRAGVPLVSVDVEKFFKERPEHQGLQFGQIIDRDQLFEYLESAKPVFSSVIHMGASSSTTELNVDYLKRVNIEYSQKLWNYCTAQKIPLLYASSAATYGDGAQGFDDDESKMDRLKPLNPYGESKLIFDLWALKQEQAGHHPPHWSGWKFFNVYGFGERHKVGQSSPVLAAFDQIRMTGGMRLFKSHHPDYKDGEQARDFVWVDDLVDVLQFARKGNIQRGIYNLGTGRARTFIDLARAVFKTLNQPQKIEFIDTPMHLRERYQYFTEARMERLRALGYLKPFTSLEDGVIATVRRLQT